MYTASVQANTVTTDLSGAWGMCVVTDQAFAAGVASLPGPGTDAASDVWFVWQPFTARLILATAVGFDSLAGMSQVFDSKAKRIVEEGYQIAIIAENMGSAALRFAVSMRMLSQVRGTR